MAQWVCIQWYVTDSNCSHWQEHSVTEGDIGREEDSLLLVITSTIKSNVINIFTISDKNCTDWKFCPVLWLFLSIKSRFKAHVWHCDCISYILQKWTIIHLEYVTFSILIEKNILFASKNWGRGSDICQFDCKVLRRVNKK